jgi:hypothetical protein
VQSGSLYWAPVFGFVSARLGTGSPQGIAFWDSEERLAGADH